MKIQKLDLFATFVRTLVSSLSDLLLTTDSSDNLEHLALYFNDWHHLLETRWTPGTSLMIDNE